MHLEHASSVLLEHQFSYWKKWRHLKPPSCNDVNLKVFVFEKLSIQ